MGMVDFAKMKVFERKKEMGIRHSRYVLKAARDDVVIRRSLEA
jgi:hypothetical protein